MKTPLACWFFALALSTLAGCQIAPESSSAVPAIKPLPARPNILFIYTDDHANAAIGAYGSSVAITPRLDRLANEGLRFDRAFCTNGICAPARAVVLTGKHSHINGVRDNGSIFDPESSTFPKLLRSAGYQTALIGKWHLKTDPTGFDHWEVLPGQGQYYTPDFLRPGPDGVTEKVSYPGYVTEVTTDLALEWLDGERDQDKPFLLMLQHKAPHRTWMPGPGQLDLFEGTTIPEPTTLFDDYANRASGARDQEMTIARHMWLNYDLKVPPVPGEERYENPDGPDRWANGLTARMSPVERANWDAAFGPRNLAFRSALAAGELEGDALVRWKYQRYLKNYLRCIASVDESVGRVLDYLEANGLAENTLVVYSSDQGFYLGEHGWYDKRWMYEPSLRLPLIVRWPGVIDGGRTDAHLVQNLDFAPTFLAAAGVAVPEDMQGDSLIPILQGARDIPWRDSIYYEYFEVGIHNVPPHFGVRTARYKLICYEALGEWELFDLEADPDELVSRYDDPALADVRAQLEAELVRLRADYAR